MVKVIKIAVLLTCHNRQYKTETCLKSLKDAFQSNNENRDNKISLEIFLTDDDCTDDTVKLSRAVTLGNMPLHIIEGDGNLFWAGGMRAAWREAQKRHDEWDYYLLLNDDVELLPNVFDEFFNALQYSVAHYGKEGLVSGITCDKDDPNKETYGGSVFTNKLLGKKRRLEPNGSPQPCDLTNANILLVPAIVVERIGIIDERFRHVGDYDYTYRAHRKGWPLILTAHFCGKCEYDHRDLLSEKKKILGLNLKGRIEYFNHPTRCIHDQVLGEWTKTPWRAPIVLLGRVFNMIMPRFYYFMDTIRNKIAK